jgi:O-antigen/teichoic acid export membrane protein
MYQYLLKRIDTEEFAIYALVMGIMIFAPLFSSFFTTGISRYVVDAFARGDENRVIQIISSVFPILIGWGVVFIAGGFILAWNIG